MSYFVKKDYPHVRKQHLMRWYMEEQESKLIAEVESKFKREEEKAVSMVLKKSDGVDENEAVERAKCEKELQKLQNLEETLTKWEKSLEPVATIFTQNVFGKTFTPLGPLNEQNEPLFTQHLNMATIEFMANEDGMVVLKPNGTLISKAALDAINWSKHGSAITKQILVEVFGRESLAFNTLTGKPSPAFRGCNKPVKGQLDPKKVTDIINLVMQFKDITEREARNAITTKCADENKRYRQTS